MSLNGNGGAPIEASYDTTRDSEELCSLEVRSSLLVASSVPILMTGESGAGAPIRDTETSQFTYAIADEGVFDGIAPLACEAAIESAVTAARVGSVSACTDVRQEICQLVCTIQEAAAAMAVPCERLFPMAKACNLVCTAQAEHRQVYGNHDFYIRCQEFVADRARWDLNLRAGVVKAVNLIVTRLANVDGLPLRHGLAVVTDGVHVVFVRMNFGCDSRCIFLSRPKSLMMGGLHLFIRLLCQPGDPVSRTAYGWNARRHRFAGGYEYVRTLGCGGFGDVCEVKDVRSSTDTDNTAGARTLALKTVRRREHEATLWSEARCLRELAALGVTGIPDLVAVHPGQMVICPAGQPVREYLATVPAGGDHDAAVVHVVTSVYAVLQAAHAAGFVHCDVRPANIIVVRKPREGGGSDTDVLLIDWGVSVRVGEGVPRDGAIEFRCDPGPTAVPQVDIVSLGLTLVVLWLGPPYRPPWRNGTWSVARNRREWLRANWPSLRNTVLTRGPPLPGPIIGIVDSLLVDPTPSSRVQPFAAFHPPKLTA